MQVVYKYQDKEGLIEQIDFMSLQPLRNKSDIDEMYNHLTYNKIYDTISGAGNPLGLDIDKSEYSYLVKCDDDNHRWIPVKYFITIDEHRDKIINQIIDESSI
jgi:hypothetical protein